MTTVPAVTTPPEPPTDHAGPRHTTYVRLSDIRPAKSNPKAHHLPGIVAALQDYGMIDPPQVDERTGRLVGGHGRLEALVHMRQHGDHPPDGVLVDDDGEWLVPIGRGWASKNGVKARGALLVLNRLTEAGGWDDRALAAELEELHAADPGMFDTLGWEGDDLDALFRHVDDTTGTVLDDADRPPRDPAKDDQAAADAGARGAEVQCPACSHIFTPGR